MRKTPSLGSTTTEFRLLLACCRWCMGAGNSLEVRRLAQVADGGMLLELCRRHRVPGLVWHALRGAGGDLASEAADVIAAEARGNAEQGLAAAAFSQRLLDRFEAAGLPLLFLKGLTIGQLAWGNPFLKTSWDLDVLVDPKDVGRAATILGALGLQRLVPDPAASLLLWHRTHKESVWRSPDGLHLELHSRLADSPRLIPSLDVRSPTQKVTIVSGVTLPTLADEELFAYLCVHGASSAWFRLKWIADLAAFLHGRPAAEVQHLFSRSQQLGAGRSAHQALLLTATLFGPLAAPALQHTLEADRAAVWLTRGALRELLDRREPTDRTLGTAVIHLSQLALGDGASFAASELLRQGRAVASRLLR